MGSTVANDEGTTFFAFAHERGCNAKLALAQKMHCYCTVDEMELFPEGSVVGDIEEFDVEFLDLS